MMHDARRGGGVAHRRMGWAAVLIAAASVLVVGGPAGAGAPNYECQAGAQRLGIDQHRRAGLSRLGGGAVQPVTFVDGNQNGPTLDLAYTVAGRAEGAHVRGTGASVSIRSG